MVDFNDSSTKKYSLSYVHHASSFPFKYKTVAQSFDELAAQFPHYECYVFKGEEKRYTYSIFKDKINCLAKSLFQLGFRKNDHLAVCLHNCSENVVLTYVASKLGVIKVHLDPLIATRELVSRLRILRCKGIVVSANDTSINTLKDALSHIEYGSSELVYTLQCVILTGFNDSINDFTIGNLFYYDNLIERSDAQNVEENDLFEEYVSSIDPDTPLSILLTSGSTGQPKSVILTNFAIINSTRLLANHFGKFCLRYCAPLSMSHISTGIRGTLLPSATKCTVIIPARAYDPEAVMRAIDEEKCTGMMSGPALFRNILCYSNRHKYNMKSLEYVTLSGTTVQTEFLRRIEIELGIDRTGQVYGMTESATLLCSTLYANPDDNRRHTSIGKCMPHIELKLVDDNGIIVPIGIQGEIWARCYGIMRGYFNDHEKTMEKITSDGWLRTGDIAKMDEDGYLYFLGRESDIIIRDIANVYPLEIELAIGEHPNIFEVHIFSIPDSRTDSIICAFLSLKPNTKLHPNNLKLFLKDKLSTYKIPEHIRIVDNFPTTSMGKVSKVKLAEIMLKEINATNQYVSIHNDN